MSLECRRLPRRHLLRHIEQKLAICFFYTRQNVTKTAKETRLFSAAAPSNVVRRFPLWKIGQLRWLLSVVE